MTYSVKQRLLPQQAPNKPKRAMKPLYITIHNTDNTDHGATADAHARYLLNGSGGAKKSWHYTVDDHDIIQHLEDNEQGWHAGDGKGLGNTMSIGIEICMYEGMNEMLAWRQASWLVAQLMNKHSIPLSRIVPHRHWSGKGCPSRLLPHWQTFTRMVERVLADMKDAASKGKGDKPSQASQVPVNVNLAEGKTSALEGHLLNGHVYVPLRDIAEALQLKLLWDNTNKRATLSK
ncbi:N-acetylmuramoyl-L-alanine amidase [Paenibacillus assamensis]|uniref:N-acetylmuramoyl-L-alanine amidase n=1 Tax=Paenibacillus assamensis TaxID=311244 RepID=UPI0004005BCC|nr:N-acetylmuramoyl-L-alanine amidase [Paenibacillus assamensis]